MRGELMTASKVLHSVEEMAFLTALQMDGKLVATMVVLTADELGDQKVDKKDFYWAEK
jgi:hypothetical protein